jgi:hypothetical protein
LRGHRLRSGQICDDASGRTDSSPEFWPIERGSTQAVNVPCVRAVPTLLRNSVAATGQHRHPMPVGDVHETYTGGQQARGEVGFLA